MKFFSSQKTILVLFCLSTLAACNSSFILGKDNSVPPTALTEIKNTTAVNLDWKASIGSGKSQNRLVPALSDDKIVAADQNGNIVALNQAGKRLWSASIGRVKSGVGLSSTHAFASNYKSELIALNIDNGTLAWKAKLNGNAVTAPVVAHGIVIIRTISGSVTAFDELTGDIVWSYGVSQPNIVLNGGASPVIIDDKVLVPTDMGQVGLLDIKTGRVIWGKTVAKPKGANVREKLNDIDAAPIINDGVIYLNILNSGIFALSLKDSKTLWETKASGFAGLALDTDAIYTSTVNSEVVKLSAKNGEIIWRSSALLGRKLTMPVVSNHGIIVGDYEGYLHILDKNTGEILGSKRISSNGFLPDIIKKSNGIYLTDKSGSLYKVGI